MWEDQLQRRKSYLFHKQQTLFSSENTLRIIKRYLTKLDIEEYHTRKKKNQFIK
jgi:translation initiation factor 2B subunit (eIF-2B alpha/beta/delta family)